MPYHSVSMKGIHHFRHEIEMHSLCSTLLRMIFVWILITVCASKRTVLPFCFLAHMRWQRWLWQRDRFNYIYRWWISLCSIFQSVDNIWCQRQENTIDWLLSIEHTHSRCFTSLMCSNTMFYNQIYVGHMRTSEMAKPCNRIRLLLFLFVFFQRYYLQL